MFESFSAAPPDPILGLNETFRSDSRYEKINLSIGVYRDESGLTPILDCVKKAEQALVDQENSKGYLGIDGLGEFNRLVTELVLGELVDPSRVSCFQTPGGTGALRVSGDFLVDSLPGSRIWCSTPTWPNHASVFGKAGLVVESYPYLAEDRTSLNFDAMLERLEKDGRAGDVVCLHGCCHNPTGIDPTREQWTKIAALTAKLGMLPLLDFAYQGFGDGLREDLVGVQEISKAHDEFLVCSSFSKNFGLYSERIGALLVVSAADDVAKRVASRVKQVVRCNYSNPPKHGGAIVATVLADAQLRVQWESELAMMRERIHQMRVQFVEAMKQTGCTKDFSFLLRQRGMFSFSGLTPMQVDWLKAEKGIYIVGSGRINVAGITEGNMGVLTTAIADALKN